MGLSWLDVRLGFRMLRKYSGLSLAGGMALAIAIGIGAGWYDLSRDLFRPTIPLPAGDRIVEIEMRNAAGGGDERRLLHDFGTWRSEVRLLEDVGAYRTIERNLVMDGAGPEPITLAEITASGFRLVRVPPLLGRPLIEADERLGAPPVVVIGHDLWQGRFGGREDVIGRTVQLGRSTVTIVGVMPEGFAFPVNHRVWMPLSLRPSGYAPLEGPEVRVFARVAPGATQEQAYAELTAIAERVAAESPATHEHLRPRILAYGGESPGDRGIFEALITHLPILLVLLVACVNVGTLIYARTATREAEIAVRHALGASRRRIVAQLFVEALVLASVAAIVGLVVADSALKFGLSTYFGDQALPFWMEPGIKLSTVVYAFGLTLVAAATLGMLPAIRATGLQAQAQLRNLGAGGSTLKFGKVWTTAMVAQVALTVICLPPAMGMAHEAVRDRIIRDQFPAEEYLAVQVGLDRETGLPAASESPAASAARLEQLYSELERRVAQEPGVVAVTFADRLPGMQPAVRRAEVETAPGSEPVYISNLWTTSIGPGFFQTFDVPVVAGRDFHDGDRGSDARTVLVNEAFARRYAGGSSPIGLRVRYVTASQAAPEPWFEIVGMVRDIGMTPTDLGEAPYVFRAVSPAAATPLIMGVRVAGDPSGVAVQLRHTALDLDAALRIDDVRTLDELAWKVDVPQVVAAGAIVTVVALGLFLSAAGIFSLMSVSVARRTREIGLRAALGASPARLLGGVFRRAAVLVGSGVAAGNGLLLLLVMLEPELTVVDVLDALLVTSMLMLAAGLLACVEPARRALRIQPTDALKEV